jgi:hypothetical protein
MATPFPSPFSHFRDHEEPNFSSFERLTIFFGIPFPTSFRMAGKREAPVECDCTLQNGPHWVSKKTKREHDLAMRRWQNERNSSV